MKIRRYTLTVLAGILLCATVMAAGSPNFSGTWVLDTSKGKNLPMGGAIQETDVIKQSPAQLVIEVAATFQGNTTNRTVNYDLTGKPVPNRGAMGDPAETVAKWQDAALVVTWTSEGAVAGSKVVKTETRKLSTDGKTMTVMSVRGTSPPIEYVFEKK